MPPTKHRTLTLLAIAELLAMSLWFSGTAVLPQLTSLWHASVGFASWLTIAVQLGFVCGALTIAVLNLSDVFSAKWLFVVSALLAAIANALFAYEAARLHTIMAFALRFLTGALLAGVYPTGMKILATWFREGRGMALGILIGALTVGSALPHIFNAIGGLPWMQVVLAASGLAAAGAIIAAIGVEEGPDRAAQVRFDPRRIGDTFTNRPLLLANLGYLGHMWELYSMWGWIAVMLAASAQIQKQQVELAAFAVIAIGVVGCVWAGKMADRVTAGHAVEQRARVTIIAMSVSALCCLLAAFVFHHFVLLLLVALLWGIAVIADSAQFSAIVSEVSRPEYVGTALTMQTALGFLLTAFSIRVIAWIGTHHGWPWAAAAMAIGPILGVGAMARLISTVRHRSI